MQELHPEIPWRQMIGMRNRLVHDYGRIDLDVIWDAVKLACSQISCRSPAPDTTGVALTPAVSAHQPAGSRRRRARPRFILARHRANRSQLHRVPAVSGLALHRVRIDVCGTAQPDEVAGVLAEDLLYLYRHAAAVTVVRQTAPAASTDAAVHSATLRKPVGRNGLATLPRPAAQNEAEETVMPVQSKSPRPSQRSELVKP